MKEPFELEWMGGPAEHYFHKVRSGVDELAWGTFDTKDYAPSLLDAARGLWTDLSISEYRAVASFTEVVRALVEAKAPLDLIGMAGNFVADEVLHVELASRMAMELGGGVLREIDLTRFAMRRDTRLTPLQQANELVLKVCCVSEAYANGTVQGTYKAVAHPLVKSVYARIMRDEVHHHRLGGLYFEWAAERCDDAEKQRLSAVLTRALEELSVLWRRRPSKVTNGVTEEGWSVAQIRQLGWLESESMIPLAKEVVARDILAPMAALGLIVDDASKLRLLG
ncbi:MAG: hypothetical protein ACHREM_26025 [Polyangiales bacterium]